MTRRVNILDIFKKIVDNTIGRFTEKLRMIALYVNG